MNTEQQYIQAFNNGYVLAQNEPKILIAITKRLVPSNNYLEGLFAGKGQFEFDQEIEKLTKIEELRNRSKNRDKEIER